uniref:Uncharacterized protein n=1 Tax=Arundo donax TaxID=35708 RepID=A0A0A9G4H1_ARUDO
MCAPESVGGQGSMNLQAVLFAAIYGVGSTLLVNGNKSSWTFPGTSK